MKQEYVIMLLLLVLSVTLLFTGKMWGENNGLRQADANVIQELRKVLQETRADRDKFGQFIIYHVKRDSLIAASAKQAGILK